MPETVKSRKPAGRASTAFTAEEKAAMQEHVAELKRAKSGKVDGEQDLLTKIAEMTGDDRTMAERIHAIVKQAAPGLTPRTWYGMPAYSRGDKVVCFFQPAAKFKARYSTLGFNDSARLDDGNMWPTAFALIKLTAEEEARITALVQRAAG